MTLSTVEALAYWLTVAAIVLPLLGGVAAFGALAASSRAATMRDDALNSFQSSANAAIAAATARAAELEPRRIGGTQRDRLWIALEQAAHKGPIEINCVLGDGEAMAFCFQIETLLNDAGWEIADSSLVRTDAVGISVIIQDREPRPPHLATLKRAFEGANFKITEILDRSVPIDRIRVLVGSKPR